MKISLIITVAAIFSVCLASNLQAQTCEKGDCVKGKGTMSWQSGERYEGSWKNSRMHGKGTMTWSDGRKYSGDWKNGEMDGDGMMSWANGDKYKGDFKANNMEGKGVMTWATGDRYEGAWKTGKMHGKGVLKYANGITVKGSWENGEQIAAAAPKAKTAVELSGTWGLYNKSAPGDNFDYNARDLTFMADGKGVAKIQLRESGQTVSPPIKWTLVDKTLTIQYDEGDGKMSEPFMYTWNEKLKRFEDAPQPFGPEGKVQSLNIIKKK